MSFYPGVLDFAEAEEMLKQLSPAEAEDLAFYVDLGLDRSAPFDQMLVVYAVRVSEWLIRWRESRRRPN